MKEKVIKTIALITALFINSALFVACNSDESNGEEVYVPKDGDEFYYPYTPNRPFTSNRYVLINGGKEAKLIYAGEDGHILSSFVEYKGKKFPLTCIGEKACCGTSIGGVPENVTIIEYNAYGLSHSRIISLPSTLKIIGELAFQCCSELISITIPDGVTDIGKAAFAGCYSLSTVNIGSGIHEIKESTFGACSFSSITIPGNVEIIGARAFNNCKNLESFVIMNGVKTIENEAFSLCSKLLSVTIPQSVTSIGESVFSDCYSLRFVTLEDGIETIGESAFRNCYNISSIVIPQSVKSIGDHAFYNYISGKQASLRTVYSKIGEPFEINTNVFNKEIYQYGTLYVPKGTLEKYKSTKGWKDIPNIIEQ